MKFGPEYTNEHWRLNELIRHLKEADWHRIVIKLQPDLLRLTHERNKYIEEDVKVYPDLVSAMLINTLGLRFDGLLGGGNNHILDEDFSRCRASDLGISYGFYKILADACQPKEGIKDAYTLALRQDLDEQFPLMRKASLYK